MIGPRHLVSALCVAVLVLATTAPPAFAEQDEQALSAGAALMIFTHQAQEPTLTRLAPILELSYRYAVDDFWEFGGQLGVGAGLGADHQSEFVGHVAFESRYVIDALTWVPYLCLGLGALWRSDGPRAWAGGPEHAVDVTAHLGLGVEYRPARSWSIGLAAKYYLVLTDMAETTGPVHLNVSASWYLD